MLNFKMSKVDRGCTLHTLQTLLLTESGLQYGEIKTGMNLQMLSYSSVSPALRGVSQGHRDTVVSFLEVLLA